MSPDTQLSFEDLPNEVIGMIAGHCADAKDVLNLAKSCKSAKVAVDIPAIWMTFLDRQFDSDLKRSHNNSKIKTATSEQSFDEDSELSSIWKYYRTIAVALGRLDEPYIPEWLANAIADRPPWSLKQERFFQALKFVVDFAYEDGSRHSNNIALLKRMVASKHNHKRLFDTHLEVGQDRSGDVVLYQAWPLAPFFVFFLHLAFDPSIDPREVGDWDRLYELQEEAYSTEEGVFTFPVGYVERRFLFPNLTKILSIAKLYRYHLLYNKDMCELTARFMALEPSLRPSAWKEPLPTSYSHIPAVGAHWIGTSSSMSERGMVYLKQITESEDPKSFIDAKYHDWCVEHHGTFADESGFEEIFFQYPAMALWPEIHQMTIPIVPKKTFGPLRVDVYKSTPNQKGRPIVGRMRSGGKLYLIFGHLSRASSAFDMRCHSEDVKRMAFIATKVTAEWPPQALRKAALLRQVESLDTIDEDSYVYEGLVTPGGTMIVGQWRQCSDTFLDWNSVDDTRSAKCGPFIMWNVPRTTMEEEDEVKEK